MASKKSTKPTETSQAESICYNEIEVVAAAKALYDEYAGEYCEEAGRDIGPEYVEDIIRSEVIKIGAATHRTGTTQFLDVGGFVVVGRREFGTYADKIRVDVFVSPAMDQEPRKREFFLLL